MKRSMASSRNSENRYGWTGTISFFCSIASSSGEDLPRFIDFLFSRNRLNVAISRARSLAVIIIVADQLLSIRCAKPEDIPW